MMCMHHKLATMLTSVCCVQLLSSGMCIVRPVSGAIAHNRESKSRDKLLDIHTIFCRDAQRALYHPIVQ